MKPGYRTRLAVAIDQASLGCQASDIDHAVTWAINSGDKLPWWRKHKHSIIAEEGGWDGLHAAVAALTIAYMVNGDSLLDAAYKAGNEYRTSIRRQWDVGSPIERPISLESLTLSPDGEGADTTEESLRQLAQRALGAEAPPPMLDEEHMDPRVRRAWEIATEKEREALRLLSAGITPAFVGEHLGISRSAVQQRLRMLQQRLAAGPAA